MRKTNAEYTNAPFEHRTFLYVGMRWLAKFGEVFCSVIATSNALGDFSR